MAVGITQVHKLKDGRMYAVDDDVLGVARDLAAISKDIHWRYPQARELQIRLRWSDSSELFVVYVRLVHHDGQVEDQVVTMAEECDARLVHRVREIASPLYDIRKDMDARDAELAKESQDNYDETMGELAEHLAHAVRKDMGIHFKTFVPKDVGEG